MPNPFYTARVAEFTEMLARYRVTISRGDLEADCIRTPDRVVNVMETDNYVVRIETRVDMLRAKFEELALGINQYFKATVSGEEREYRITAIEADDESEPTVQFTAARAI